ncbi:MAG: hypothetical protein DI626_08040 [Micavibrio aeruginosavorus]|uniref:Lipoprotein n=1 Tax=Micavibrio aeruginosavorus TaxID=349221 RepID=A0A2W5BN73_9BACT|nr:MAG: hypothetical protein DI626_08040 [Micavibrio aeruginosavorus]
MSRRALIFITSILPVMLAGCGEGYEVVKVRGQVPYTEERTAGVGVAYVRAHLMPEKTIVIPDPAPAPVIVQDAEPIFDLRQQKK